MKMMVFEGTPGEIADLLERMPHLGGATIVVERSDKPITSAGLTNPAYAVWTRERVAEMWRETYGDQRKLVSYLKQNGGKATLSDVKKHLGFHKGPQIAGVLSSITRNARRITKYREARFVEDWLNEKQHTWGYMLPEPVLGFLREITEADKEKGEK